MTEIVKTISKEKIIPLCYDHNFNLDTSISCQEFNHEDSSNEDQNNLLVSLPNYSSNPKLGFIQNQEGKLFFSFSEFFKDRRDQKVDKIDCENRNENENHLFHNFYTKISKGKDIADMTEKEKFLMLINTEDTDIFFRLKKNSSLNTTKPNKSESNSLKNFQVKHKIIKKLKASWLSYNKNSLLIFKKVSNNLLRPSMN